MLGCNCMRTLGSHAERCNDRTNPWMALCRSDDAGAPDVLIAFFVPLVPINQAHCAIDRERTTLQPVARGPSSRLGRCILRATMVDAYEWIRAAGDPGAKPQATADFDDGY